MHGGIRPRTGPSVLREARRHGPTVLALIAFLPPPEATVSRGRRDRLRRRVP